MVVDHQRTGSRTSEGLRRKETQEASNKDPLNTTREAEPQTVADGVTEAHTL
jgi:ribosome assembly protein YihI (activator of Der GTPase)